MRTRPARLVLEQLRASSATGRKNETVAALPRRSNRPGAVGGAAARQHPRSIVDDLESGPVACAFDRREQQRRARFAAPIASPKAAAAARAPVRQRKQLRAGCESISPTLSAQ